MSSLLPLADKIALKQLKAEDKSLGGIILPDSAKKKPERGIVVAVGPGRMLKNGTIVPVAVKVGDEVLYSIYGGAEVKDGAEEYLIVSETDILAVVRK